MSDQQKPMNYWVRERPAGSGALTHFVVLCGTGGCSEGELPLEFPTWEMARSFANAMANYPSTDAQREEHVRIGY